MVLTFVFQKRNRKIDINENKNITNEMPNVYVVIEYQKNLQYDLMKSFLCLLNVITSTLKKSRKNEKKYI